MKFKSLFVISIIIILLLLAYNGYEYYSKNIPANEIAESEGVCGVGEGCELSKKRVQGFDPGDQIPNIELTDFEGNKTKLYDLLEGKDKFVLSFIVDWCSDCQRQDDKMKEYYDELPENYGYAAVYVDYSSSDGTKTTNKDQAQQYNEEQDYPFPTFWDENNELNKKLGKIKATPTNLVLDENAVIKAKTEEIDADILFLDNNDEITKEAPKK